MYALCWARSLRGHCVNAPHLPADCSPDWLLMTFLGHRHVKLFIYSKKKKIPNANRPLSTLHLSPPHSSACRHICLSFCVGLLKQRWCAAVISKTLWYNSGAAVFVVYACVCVCVGTRVMRQCASDACDRYGTSLRKVTQPLQAIAFKKNLQQNSTTTI